MRRFPSIATTPYLPILGVLVAIACTTTMDACGLSAFSALPLIPLVGLFWYLERHSRQAMGFIWGRLSHYGLAALYPIAVLGLVGVVSAVAGVVDISHADWKKASLNFVIVTVSTILGAIITEEGFFRGWLFASLKRAGENPSRILLWSSIAFALWHLSAVTLDTGFDLPLTQVPVFMINAALMGAVWGLLRIISGSILVASLSHGVWNGGAYVFFGFGTKTGVLDIEDTAVFGPEVGILGLALNMAFVAALWLWWKKRTEHAA